ncbi:hypothetical protein B0T26DRAFT_184141 [Lasiosphaeria miniovina]|uniref:Uncharacterized protein n=1 Tax=Lasiosphaeria miniovina TaxID=1954250 RepID=A0AA40E6F0_9PEZI|nr:uncharacterized protein B0T26DRAFT_184141 [Lasiosphaeria miniovina]KAK0728720.1 hypothetical protein B0T26DRAFT_184141 [Lasiosphaeria miniovina]
MEGRPHPYPCCLPAVRLVFTRRLRKPPRTVAAWLALVTLYIRYVLLASKTSRLFFLAIQIYPSSASHTFCFLLLHSPHDVVILSVREARGTGICRASDILPVCTTTRG